MHMTVLPAVLIAIALIGSAHSASNPRVVNLVRLIADVLYKAPANNDFIIMVENKMMDNGIANIIEGMSPKFAAPGACTKFRSSSPGQLSVGPVQKRGQNSLQQDVLNVLDSAEGKAIIAEGAKGNIMNLPPPRFNSGGLNFNNRVGKRSAADNDKMQTDILNMLDTSEGMSVMKDKVAGKAMNIPPPRYSSAGFRGRWRRAVKTAHGNISKGQHAGFAGRATALMARVRNICVNKASLRLFNAALDDGTVRAAMYNVCQCNAIAKTIRNLYNMGTF